MKGEEFKKLYIKDGRILPNNVDVIDDYLDLNYCNISKIENLPKVIKGFLILNNNNKIKILENLPEKIYGKLYLYNLPIEKIKSIPKYINGIIWLCDSGLFDKYHNLFYMSYNKEVIEKHFREYYIDYKELKRIFKIELLKERLK